MWWMKHAGSSIQFFGSDNTPAHKKLKMHQAENPLQLVRLPDMIILFYLFTSLHIIIHEYYNKSDFLDESALLLRNSYKDIC